MRYRKGNDGSLSFNEDIKIVIAW